MDSQPKVTSSNNQLAIEVIAWALSSLAALAAILAWGSTLRWQLSGLSIYQIFPLFGLMAFSVMWSHYAASFLNKAIYKQAELGLFYKTTGYFVLLAIVLHPGLLAYQRFRDGFGLPLGSYTSYVSSSAKWIVLLGEVSLLMFLAFELRRRYMSKPWWRFVVYANDAAMLGIFYHGLRLGTNLQTGWFHGLWLFYGLSLMAILVYLYAYGWRTKKSISG